MTAHLTNTTLMHYPSTPGSKTGGTSEEAARDIAQSAPFIRDRVMALLRESPFGLTADECALRLRLDKLSVRPRFSELKEMGKIYASPTRRENSSGKMAVVWMAT